MLYAIVLAGRWKQRIPFYVSLICLVMLALTYYVPVKMMSNPGWSTLFYHAFINNTADPSVKQTITAPLYFNVIRESFLNVKGIIAILVLLILSFFVLNFKNEESKKIALYKFFYLAVILWIIVKFSLFPMPGLRFIIPPFLLLFFVIVKKCELIFFKKYLK